MKLSFRSHIRFFIKFLVLSGMPKESKSCIKVLGMMLSKAPAMSTKMQMVYSPFKNPRWMWLVKMDKLSLQDLKLLKPNCVLGMMNCVSANHRNLL